MAYYNHRGGPRNGPVPNFGPGYDPHQTEYYYHHGPQPMYATRQQFRHVRPTAPPRRSRRGAGAQVSSSPRGSPRNMPRIQSPHKSQVNLTISDLHAMILETRDEICELRGENICLKQTINQQSKIIAELDRQLDELNQYGRRENVVFSNILFDDSTKTVGNQISELCNELGVDVQPEDYVDAHPLPGRKGKGQGKSTRVIARFKSRSKAQKNLASRKNTKNIDKKKKAALAADPARGFAVQPKLAPRRARLHGQAKDAKEGFNFDSLWVDPRTGTIMMRVHAGAKPFPIKSTLDIVKLAPNFKPQEWIFCCPDVFDVFNCSQLQPGFDLDNTCSGGADDKATVDIVTSEA